MTQKENSISKSNLYSGYLTPFPNRHTHPLLTHDTQTKAASKDKQHTHFLRPEKTPNLEPFKTSANKKTGKTRLDISGISKMLNDQRANQDQALLHTS